MSNGVFDYAALIAAMKKPRLEIYQDVNKKYRWRIFMSSDEVAASTQGYSTKAECLENLKKIPGYIITLEKEGKLV